MRKWLYGVVTCLVVCLSGSVKGEELGVYPFGGSLLVDRFNDSGTEGRTRLFDALEDVREPKVRLSGWSGSESDLNGDAGRSTVPLSSRTGDRRSIEIVPFTGYQIGGKFEDEETDTTLELADASSWGFLVDYDYTKDTQIEFYYSHQESELSSGGLIGRDKLFDMDVDYYHIGGTYKWRQDKWEPFVVGTVGVTRFDPESSEADSLTRFSLGLGGGVRYFPAKRVGIYLGGRAFVTLVESEFRYISESDGTTLTISANALWQFQYAKPCFQC
jgi:opacity protein-like surface antigen